MPAPRRTILLTGPSGVVGRSLLPLLARHRVVCLVHRTAPPGAAEHVRGDLSQPGLGLDRVVAERLLRSVDTVVHCAALTSFAAAATDVSDVNVSGTRRVVEFAERAGAVLHHLSTAFVARSGLARPDVSEGKADPRAYLDSKRAAEQVVSEAGLPGTVIRPSVVIGDGRTGDIAAFQGLHDLMRAVLRNALPLVPLRPGSRIDVVPQDLLAAAITGLVDSGATGGTHWVTSGEAAPTAAAMVDLCVRVGEAAGMASRAPRLVVPDMVDRLIRPVFIDPLPRSARRRFDDLIAMAAPFATDDPFPSTVGEIPGCVPLTRWQVATAFVRSVEHLVRVERLAPDTGAARPGADGEPVTGSEDVA